MSFNGTATRDQLLILRQVLEEYCQHHGVTSDEDRNDAGEMVMSVFVTGAKTFDSLVAGIEAIASNRLLRRTWPSDSGRMPHAQARPPKQPGLNPTN